MEPTNTQFLVVICDIGEEDDSMFSAGDLDLRGGVGCRVENEKQVFFYIPRNLFGLMRPQNISVSSC